MFLQLVFKLGLGLRGVWNFLVTELYDMLSVAQAKLSSTGKMIAFVIIAWSVNIRNCAIYCMDKKCRRAAYLWGGSTSVSSWNDSSWNYLFIYSLKKMSSSSCLYDWVSHWYCYTFRTFSWKPFHCLAVIFACNLNGETFVFTIQGIL